MIFRFFNGRISLIRRINHEYVIWYFFRRTGIQIKKQVNITIFSGGGPGCFEAKVRGGVVSGNSHLYRSCNEIPENANKSNRSLNRGQSTLLSVETDDIVIKTIGNPSFITVSENTRAEI